MKKILAIVFVALLALSGCTANSRAKKFGGTQEIDLPKDTKMLQMTWKNDNLWILTRKMKEGEAPETYKFVEDSSWGIMEGTIIVNEH